MPNLGERLDGPGSEHGVLVPGHIPEGRDRRGVAQPPELGCRVAARSVAFPEDVFVADPAPGRAQAPDVDGDVVRLRLSVVTVPTDVPQDLAEEVEQRPELPEVLDRPFRPEVEFVHPVGELAEPPATTLDGQMDLRLGLDAGADLPVVEEAPQPARRIALDHEVPVEPGMADLDVLQPHRLPQPAQETGPVDLEPEPLRIEVGGADPRERLVRLAVARRVRVEGDDPVAGAGLDGERAEEAAFVELPVHVLGELPPHVSPARSEQGFEEFHRNRTTGCLTFRSVFRCRSCTVTHSQRFSSTEYVTRRRGAAPLPAGSSGSAGSASLRHRQNARSPAVSGTK